MRDSEGQLTVRDMTIQNPKKSRVGRGGRRGVMTSLGMMRVMNSSVPFY